MRILLYQRGIRDDKIFHGIYLIFPAQSTIYKNIKKVFCFTIIIYYCFTGCVDIIIYKLIDTHQIQGIRLKVLCL